MARHPFTSYELLASGAAVQSKFLDELNEAIGVRMNSAESSTGIQYSAELKSAVRVCLVALLEQ